MSTKFRPVRGKEEKILSQEITNGYFYLATDTGRIFIDTSDGRVSVGGGAGASLFYAGAVGNEIQKISEDTSDKNYLLPISSLENPEVLPKKNDLILNSDGSFFKILSFEGDQIHCLLLTVSGSGSGGGGGGEAQVADLTLTVNSSTITTNQTLIYGQKHEAIFTGTSTEDSYVNFEFKITGLNGWERTFSRPGIPSGEPYALDLSFLPVGTFRITVSISSDNTRMKEMPTRVISNIKVIEMGLEKYGENPNSVVNINGSDRHQVSFIPRGTGLNLTLHIFSDGSEIETRAITAGSIGTVNTIPLPHQSHGVHNISLNLTTELNGEVYTSTSIEYECAWYDPADSTPIIWIGDYNSTVVKYEKCIIPFMVYDPETAVIDGEATVRLYLNGTELPNSPIQKKYDLQWTNWDVTSHYQEGNNVLTIACGTTSKNINIYVTLEGSRDLDLVKKDWLQLNLSSVGRSNLENRTNRQIWAYKNFNTTFNNFNWYNNGWREDETGTFLSVANGASASINFQSLTLNNQNDYTFEIRFRARNIRSYSTLIKTIPRYEVNEQQGAYTVEEIEENGYTYKTDEDGNYVMDKSASTKEASSNTGVCCKMMDSNGNGFCIGTQEAYFSAGGSIANVRYKENEVINIAFVVSATDKNLLIYLNGILSGAISLTAVSSFILNTNVIEINSTYCDFDLYKIRVYQSGLTMPEIIHNYISDIGDIDLYDQNQLTADTDPTRLLYTKVVEYNENQKEKVTKDNLDSGLLMPYAVIETLEDVKGIKDPNDAVHVNTDDRLPYFKGNDRYCKITFVNPALDLAWENGWIDDNFYLTHSPSYVVVGAEINVQGTSSQAYPRRNYKTKMKSASGSAPEGWVDDENYAWGWYYTNGPKKGEKFKKWNMDSASCATNKFTWKIDYMESSGSYNTGFANLMGNGLYSKHPLEYYDDDGMKGAAVGHRTSVYGFPVMVFHKHNKAGKYVPSNQQSQAYDAIRNQYAWTGKEINGETDEWKAYEYIGRYNLNLDKGSNEFYGFEAEVEQPFVNEPWIDSETGEEHDHPYIAGVAECWELRDNQGTWCSFKYPENVTSFAALTTENTLEVIKHFEYRYHPEDKLMDMVIDNTVRPENTAVKGYNGKKYDISTQSNLNSYARQKYSNLERLFTWLNSTRIDTVPATDTGTPLAEPVSFEDDISYMVRYEKDEQGNNTTVFHFVDSSGADYAGEVIINNIEGRDDLFDFARDEENNIITSIQAPKEYEGDAITRKTLVTFNTDCKDYRLHKFKTEFNNHLNLDYCILYFIMTELLLCYDSRGKNMMLASFGPDTVGGDYIWFPIFYDIDTQLGLNNIGAALWDYDTDATIEGTFSTARSVLWTNLFEVFYTSIKDTYRNLRASKLSQSFIEGAYLCDPKVFTSSYAMKGLRPIIALGLDEYVKYIACGSLITGGYYNQTDGEVVTDSAYVYACQGDRKLSRSLLIRNRLNYIDSWWLAGNYTPARVKNEIMIRANANDKSTSDIYLDSSRIQSAVEGYTLAQYPVKYFDATPEFTITPFLNQYVTVFYDEDPVLPSKKYSGERPVTTSFTTSVENGYRTEHPYNEQLVYLPAGDNLSSFGDLSTKYPSHFKLSSGKNLTEIILGSDIPGYSNGLLGSGEGTFDLHDNGTSDDQRKGLLSKIILTNIPNITQPQDVRGSEKLVEYRALGTKIPYTTFADGAPLDTIHLPDSTQQLTLVKPENLKRILTSKPVVMQEGSNGEYTYINRDLYKGLYIEGVTDDAEIEDKFSRLKIVGGGLGYDSYLLLEKQVNKKKNVADKYLEIDLEDVQWCPYSLVENGEAYNESQTYFLLTDHNSFENYSYVDNETWVKDLLNERVFIENELSSKRNSIQSLDLLDMFLEDYQNTSTDKNNKWRNATSASTRTLPTITGTMYIDNPEENKINEVDLLNIYRANWPSLTIYAAHLNESYISKFIQVTDNGKEEVVDLLRTNSTTFSLTSKIPVKTYYDFIGWATSPNAEDILYNYSADTGEFTLQDGASAPTFSEENKTIVLYAIFDRHEYTIDYYLDDETFFESKKVAYGDLVELPSQIPYKNDSNLAIDRTYKFMGYTTSLESNSFVNPAKIIAQRDMSFYCKFKESSVRDNVNYDLFVFERATFTDNISGESFSGYAISPKVTLQGKITIPTTYQNEKVISCRGFRNQTELTHLFVQSPSAAEIVLLETSCFESCAGLKHCELLELDSLRYIYERVFANCTSLCNRTIGGDNLHFIGNGAFIGSFGGDVTEPLTIAPSVKRLNNGTSGIFYNCPVALDSFVIGAPGQPTQLTNWNTGDVAPIFWCGSIYLSMVKAITIYCSPEDAQRFNDLVYNSSYTYFSTEVNPLFGTNTSDSTTVEIITV